LSFACSAWSEHLPSGASFEAMSTCHVDNVFSIAWFMARMMEMLWRGLSLTGERPLTRQMLRMIDMPVTLDIGRARRELDYHPVVTWRQGI
jgi:nucleoside-diphosphate-sugar epimerase